MTGDERSINLQPVYHSDSSLVLRYQLETCYNEQIFLLTRSKKWHIRSYLNEYHTRITRRSASKNTDGPFVEGRKLRNKVARPRILVDVTSAANSSEVTGIQRFVFSFAASAYETGLAVPVLFHNGHMLDAYGRQTNKQIEVESRDILFLLDANWDLSNMMPALMQLRERCGRVVVFIHDMVPLDFPATCGPDVRDWYVQWLKDILPHADGLMTSTAAAAERIRHHISSEPFRCLWQARKRSMPLGWTAPAPLAKTSLRDCADQVCRIKTICRCQQTALSVGTIEPRKGYPLILEAMERMWADGQKVNWLIIGFSGWGMKHFEETLKTHAKFNINLFWINDADDKELQAAYLYSTLLISASLEEGFGLPVVEAANHGLTALLSDIPVYREVGAPLGASYFKVADTHSLYLQLKDKLKTGKYPKVPLRKLNDWRIQVKMMSRIIRDECYQSTVD